jgi:hypothetical protein
MHQTQNMKKTLGSSVISHLYTEKINQYSHMGPSTDDFEHLSTMLQISAHSSIQTKRTERSR